MLTLVCAGSVRAAGPGEIESVRLPGGVEGIRRALGDRVATEPATIGVDLTRRFYNATDDAARKDELFARLLGWLRACETSNACEAAPLRADLAPLPGPAAFWRETVLDGRPRPEHLMLAILGNRRAALLYTAMLSLDEAPRAWLVERPDLVRRLTERDCGALVVAAPFLRLEEGRWRLPGGAAAEPLWMDLASARLEDSPAFLVALLRAEGGLVTYALEVVATLSAAQQEAFLRLGAPPSERTAAGRALLNALKPAAEFWQPGERPFWRPSIDPAFLLAQLRLDATGRPALPGSKRFWELVFAASDVPPSDNRARDAWADGDAPSPAWLAARVASAPLAVQITRYEQVLFATRVLGAASPSQAPAVMTALWGHARLPQLVRVLERVGVTDPERLARIVRQAHALTRAGESGRALRALIQWQSVVALIDRGVHVGALSAEDAGVALDSLTAVSTDETSGVWIAWLGRWLGVAPDAADAGAQPLEYALINRITAPASAAARRVRWEDAVYRLDPGAGDRDRITRVRGRDRRPLLDAAFAVHVRAASPRTRAADDLAAVAALAEAAGVDRTLAVDDALGRALRDAAAAARRSLSQDGGGATSARSRAAMGELSDALAACALLELAYAANMGWAEDLPLTAAAAARRHVFTRDASTRRGYVVWQPPSILTDTKGPWQVAGSVLGLDVALAPVALRRVSRRPLSAAPLLNNADRAVFISTVAVLDRRDLSDEGQQALRAHVTRGRERLAAASSPADVARVSTVAGISPLRRALAAWLAGENRPALDGFFSLTELLHIGLDGAPMPASLARWGNFEGSISGRLTTGDLPSLPWERYAGRSGRLLALAVPDVQLSLALALAELDLPASLVPDLLPAATYDVINSAASRHTDDWQAMALRARSVDRLDAERYLGLLTTLGPLRAEPETTTH